MLKQQTPSLTLQNYMRYLSPIPNALFLALLGTFISWLAFLCGVRELGILGIIICAGASFVFLSIITHPLVPFSLYFSCLFFTDTNIYGFPISLNQVLGILFFISWFSYFVRGKTIAISGKCCAILILATIWFAISAITGEDAERGMLHFRALITYLFMAICLASSLTSERSIRALAWIITITTAAAALQGIYQAIDKNIFENFTGKWSDAVRVSGMAKNSIVYGWNLLYAFPFAFFLYTQHKRRFYRNLALGLGLVTTLVALLTFNRQTFLLIAILIPATTMIFSYPNKKQIFGYVLVAIGFAIVLIFPMIFARLTTIENIKRDASYLERRDQFIVAVEMFKEKPVTGIGLGAYPAVWKNHLPKDYSTYNMQYDYKSERYPDFGYLQLLAETGIVGLLLALVFMAMIVTVSWRIRRLAGHYNDIFAFNFASLVFILGLFWIVSNGLQDTFLYVRVWILLALTLLLTPHNFMLESAYHTEQDQ